MWNFKLHPFHFQVDWSNPQNLVPISNFSKLNSSAELFRYRYLLGRIRFKKGGKSENSLLNTTEKKNHIYEHIRCWNFGVKLLNNTSVGDDDRLKRELEAFFSVCVGCKYPESKSKKKYKIFSWNWFHEKNIHFFYVINFTKKNCFFFTVKSISWKKNLFFLWNQFHEKTYFFFTQPHRVTLLYIYEVLVLEKTIWGQKKPQK